MTKATKKVIENYINELKIQADGKEQAAKDYLDSSLLPAIKQVNDKGGKILKLSKEVANDTINHRLKTAEKKLKSGKNQIKKLNRDLLAMKELLVNKFIEFDLNDDILKQVKHLERRLQGAKEEFLEAEILFKYSQSGDGTIFKPHDDLFRDFRVYVGALSDFCGELLRKARTEGISEDEDFQEHMTAYYETVKNVYYLLSSFSFSNKSGMRSKIEQIKGRVSCFEDMLYDYKIRHVSGTKTKK